MATFTVNPTTPVPNFPADVSITLQEPNANWAITFIDDAPEGSEFKKKLDAKSSTRELVDQSNTLDPFIFRPDKGGTYSFKVQEYVRGTVFGGGYQNDPDSDPSLTKAGTEYSLTIAVAQRMKQTITVREHSADLIIYLQVSTVRATQLAVHNEKSPTFLAEEPTQAVITAIVNAQTNLDALAGKTIATVYTRTSAEIIDEFIDTFNAHLTQANVHDNNDTANAIGLAFKGVDSPDSLVISLNECLRKYFLHIYNSDNDTSTIAVPLGPGTGTWHQSGGGTDNATDTADDLTFESIGQIPDVHLGAADLWRAYEGHRLSAVHKNTDTTNTLTAVGELTTLYQGFLDDLRKSSPTSPGTVNTGVTTLVHDAGFEESPL